MCVCVCVHLNYVTDWYITMTNLHKVLPNKL
jgi:hypothetical protein